MDPPYPAPHDWREWRRMRALELKHLGWKQRDIAAALGVTEGAVSQWLAAARRGGRDAIVSHLDHCGMTPKLTPEQVRLIPDLLWHGAEAGRGPDARPAVGHGRRDAAGQGVFAGPANGAEWVAQHRVPRPSGPSGRGSVVGHLGRVADPPACRAPGVCGGGRRQDPSGT